MRGVSLSEIRNAARSLWRSPSVTLCAVLCLAVGIGATTALSSAISTALLRPLPFRESDRLVTVHRITPHSGPQGAWAQSAANYVDLARQSKQLQELAAISWGSAVIDLPDNAVEANQKYVTGNFFQTLGTHPELGRFLTPDDDRADAPMVGVISDELWRSTFGGDASIVGRTVEIDNAPTVIVGVAPRRFRVPVGPFFMTADLWTPMRFTAAQLTQRSSNYLQTLGRLAPGATVASAESELRGIFANLVRQYPDLAGDNVRVAPMQSENLRTVRTPLLLLFGAVCMVLLIAATNVAALLLARGVQRQREMAVRAALGASRSDALRPVLLESFLLSGASVILGVALAAAGVKSIGLLAAQRMEQLQGLRLDPGVLAFALVLSIVVAILCGIAPAVRSARVNPQDALRGGRGGGTGREHHRALRTLVVVEISLSLVLLIGAGLVLKGFARLMASDPGFDASRILTLKVTTAPSRYPEQNAVQYFLDPALAAIQQVPGVEAAATISAVPYETWGNNSGIRYEGVSRGDPTKWPIVEQRQISPGFFDVTKQRLVSGRLLTPSDDEKAPTAVVVNQTLVKRDFHGADPVGKRFYTSDTTFGTIVGVVSDIRNAGPFRAAEPEMYTTLRQGGSGWAVFNLVVRVRSGDPNAVISGVRGAIRKTDATAAVANAIAMPDLIAQTLGMPRFYFILLGTFAGIAILLAVAGLYGVLSYVVAQRTREIGIRSALGSTRAGIVRLVALEGFRLVALGLVLGLAGGTAVTRLMEFMLYGVSPLDATTWALAPLVLLAAAMLAAVVPARRASRVDPLVAIQTE
jgi:putative ABC transport system permease protein